MTIKIYTIAQQAKGNFDYGKIKENKPIGFPGDGGDLRPYSNIFYWAYAWSENGGLIDQHPHKGFEIMSYVVKGSIEHYDNKLNGWKRLNEGDVQIIRAGNGIVHAERILPDSAMFQIWMDPDISRTITKPASYNDYRSNDFKIFDFPTYTVKIIRDNPEKFPMDSEGIKIVEYDIHKNTNFSLNKDTVYSCYLISGELKIGPKTMKNAEFMIIKESENIEIEVNSPAVLFVVESPLTLSYRTYAEQYM